jgi:hypothetical protein
MSITVACFIICLLVFIAVAVCLTLLGILYNRIVHTNNNINEIGTLLDTCNSHTEEILVMFRAIDEEEAVRIEAATQPLITQIHALQTSKAQLFQENYELRNRTQNTIQDYKTELDKEVSQALDKGNKQLREATLSVAQLRYEQTQTLNKKTASLADTALNYDKVATELNNASSQKTRRQCNIM